MQKITEIPQLRVMDVACSYSGSRFREVPESSSEEVFLGRFGAIFSHSGRVDVSAHFSALERSQL